MTQEEFATKVQDAKEEFGILGDIEAEEACHFVAKLIEIETERMLENEPYAKVSIAEYQKMESEVYNFFDNTIQAQLEEMD